MRAPRAVALSLCLAALSAPAARAGSPDGVGNPVAEIPLASLSATRERPLFAPSRRPPPPAPAPAAEPAAEAAKSEAAQAQAQALKLLGTAIGPSARRAVVVEGADPPASLAEGDSAWGWTLRARRPALGDAGGVRPDDRPGAAFGRPGAGRGLSPPGAVDERARRKSLRQRFAVGSGRAPRGPALSSRPEGERADQRVEPRGLLLQRTNRGVGLLGHGGVLSRRLIHHADGGVVLWRQYSGRHPQ